MMTMRILAVGAAVLAVVVLAGMQAEGDEPERAEGQSAQKGIVKSKAPTPAKVERVRKSDAEWRQVLSDQEFYVTRRKGTEPAFTGRYWNHHGDGIYRCVCCNTPLFDSKTKFESGTGWPSFFAPIDKSVLRTERDVSNFTVRTEVLCRVCDAHLGHVFRDGPRPTGLRFCMNSVSLRFQDRAQAQAEAAAKAVLESNPEPDPSSEETEEAGTEPEPTPVPE